MRLTSRIAAATVLVAVGQSAAGQVEEILVVEKKQAGWIAWQTDLDTYCTKLLTTVDYGALPPGKPGGAGCFPGGNNPPTFIQIRFDRNQLTWHWAAIATIHEFIHVGDYIRYGSCAPWRTPGGAADVDTAGFDATADGMHA